MGSGSRGKFFGLTLTEMVMVILLITLLAVMLIPHFFDFRTEAKNTATQNALVALRAAINGAAATIALHEDPTTPTPKYPTLAEVQRNVLNNSHPALAGTPILDPALGIPKNPWTLPSLPQSQQSAIIDCGTNATRSAVSSLPGSDSRGWCYRESTGEIWANSSMNGAGAGKTENTY